MYMPKLEKAYFCFFFFLFQTSGELMLNFSLFVFLGYEWGMFVVRGTLSSPTVPSSTAQMAFQHAEMLHF